MKVIIVGGGAAGASCAARLRRLDEKAEICILEASGEISIANCGLPYYCSEVIACRDEMLVSNPTVFKNLLNVEVRLFSKVTSINRKEKTVKVNDKEELKYDKLVLATGSQPIKPASIKGIDNKKIFTVKTLEDADKIKNFIKENNVSKAVVVGGGFIGLEMLENFLHMGFDSTLIELASQVLLTTDYEIAAIAQNELNKNGAKMIFGDEVVSFGDKEVELKSGKKIEYDIAILAIGVSPVTSLAKDSGLELGLKNSIKVNEFMQTSDSDIYAAGDNIEVKDFVSGESALIPLAGPANRQGRIIADNIAGIKSTYKDSQGTSVLKVFDKTIASVGLTEKALLNKKIPFKKNIIIANTHASYYPGAQSMTLKLLFSDEGKILGAQAAGGEGTEKRIDVIASIMRLGGTVQDLLDSELCYAPPYSGAKDPVNLIGMSSDNILKGLVKPAFYEDLDGAMLIDVRPKELFDISTIKGAINIPVAELRKRIKEVPKDKKVILFCGKGFNSYIAARILMGNAYDKVYSFMGGKTVYDEIVKALDNKEVSIPKDKDTSAKSAVQTISSSAKTNTIRVDVCGMQCPGPVMKISSKMEELNEGDILEVLTKDSDLITDTQSWCKSTGNTFIDHQKTDEGIIIRVSKGSNIQPDNKTINTADGQTIVVFSNDMDKVLAAMIIANGARAAGKNVTLFFTFWGLNALRRSNITLQKDNIIEKAFGIMMPKGAKRLKLSKMNMFGLGTLIMKKIMKKKNVPSLEELIENAKNSGVKIIACTMAMDIMGIKKEELIDGIEYAGVATYIADSQKATSNLFV